MRERRQEQRFEVTAAPAAVTSLESVTLNLRGQVLDVSARGMKIRIAEPVSPVPHIGELYRIRGASDRMLCRVAYFHPCEDGTEIGFRIVYWHQPGELHQVVANRSRPGSAGKLRDLRIPQLA